MQLDAQDFDFLHPRGAGKDFNLRAFDVHFQQINGVQMIEVNQPIECDGAHARAFHGLDSPLLETLPTGQGDTSVFIPECGFDGDDVGVHAGILEQHLEVLGIGLNGEDRRLGEFVGVVDRSHATIRPSVDDDLRSEVRDPQVVFLFEKDGVVERQVRRSDSDVDGMLAPIIGNLQGAGTASKSVRSDGGDPSQTKDCVVALKSSGDTHKVGSKQRFRFWFNGTNRLHLALQCCLLGAILCGTAFGTTRYVAQSAGVFSGGTACNGQTAVTPATFNAATIAAGDVVWLCGTMTFSASATAIVPHNSGSAGNPITINFDTGAILQAPDFGAGGTAISVDNKTFITIDGMGTGNAAQGTFVPNGTIQATLSGTSGAACIGGPCTRNVGGTGVRAQNATNIIIKNLLIQDMYLRTLTSDQAPDWSTYFCISAFPGATNLLIDNNLMHDSGEIVSATGAGMIIRNNYMYNTNHGIATGLAGTSVSGAYIYANHFGSMANWDAGTPFPYHHDGIHFFQNPGPGFWDNVFIYSNTFDGDIGTSPTGWVFLEATCCTGGHVYLFNNSANGGSRSAPAEYGIYSGIIFFAQNTTWSNFWTNSGIACDIGHNDATISVWQNTICQGQSVSFNVQPNSPVSGTGAINFNLVGSGSSNGNQQNYSYQGNNTQSLTTWKSIALNGATTHDANSILATNFAALNLNSDGTLAAGSPAIGAGTNLFSTCNGQPNPGLGALCSDKNGNPRPSSGGWDIGAFNFSSGAVATPTFSPVAGTYAGARTVAISTSTSGATICYTTDGSTPTANGAGTCTAGSTYVAPIAVLSTQTVKAIGSKSTFTDSAVGSALFTINPAVLAAPMMISGNFQIYGQAGSQ